MIDRNRKRLRAIDVYDLVNAVRTALRLTMKGSDKSFAKEIQALLSEKDGPRRLRNVLKALGEWVSHDVFLPVEVKDRPADNVD